MKKPNIKLLSLLFAAFTMSTVMVSCGSDDTKPNPETNNGVSNFYASLAESEISAWGLVKFTYSPQPMYDANETFKTVKGSITINGNTTKVDSLYFSSPMWGKGKFDLTTKTGTMEVARRNPQTMEITGDPITYDATISGSEEERVFIISIPTLMGGTTITSNIGSKESYAYIISDTYSINSYVDNANNYFPAKSYATADETMVIVASNDFKGVNIQYTSQSTPSWGTFAFENAAVTKESGVYKIEGEGTATIANHQGNAKEYVANISAKVKDGEITGEISIPGVMGGIILHLNPEDFYTVVNGGNE